MEENSERRVEMDQKSKPEAKETNTIALQLKRRWLVSAPGFCDGVKWPAKCC